MVEQDEWVFFRDIDWKCPNNNRFNVDTRDFHCGYNFNKSPHKDIETLKKYKHFFYSEIELKEVIERLFVESGGVGEWRCLNLESNDSRVVNWNLKYLRIFRHDEQYIICNSNNEAIPKDILNLKVNQEFLHHH
jgi:hypothetical protein